MKHLFPLPVIAFVLFLACSSEESIPVNTHIDSSDQGDDNTLSSDTLILNETLLNASSYTVITEGIYAYWWDTQFDYTEELPILKAWIEALQVDLNNLGIPNPTCFTEGFYTNIYIHNGKADSFPDEWGIGVGYDRLDLPYMTLPPDIAFKREDIVAHELFHIFQSSSYYEFIDFERAAHWIVEGLAEWYRMRTFKDTDRAFINVDAIQATPDISLWQVDARFKINEAEYTEDELFALGWVYGIRQYANGSFFYFLTEIKNISPTEVIQSMFHRQKITPQEYLFNSLGADNLRNLYTEWASRNSVGFDYLPDNAFRFSGYTKIANLLPDREIHEKPFVHIVDDINASGSFAPDSLYQPKAWGYNVIKINNTSSATYSFNLHGNSTGNRGTSSHFEALLAVKKNDGSVMYHPFSMTDATKGSLSVNVSADDCELFLTITAVPELFNTNESFNYFVDIIRD